MAQLTIPLYPELFPQTIPHERQEKTEGGERIYNVHYPTLSVYLPAPSIANGSAVVICPGGGYRIIASDHEGKQMAAWLNTLGIAALVLKYRLPPGYRHPIPMQDAQRAIRLARAHAGEWNIKSDRIGIMGFSAGGHLASTAATHFDAGNSASTDPVERKSCRPDFLILGYPVICFSKDYCHAGSRQNLTGEHLPPDIVRFLSSELHVTADTPPAFIFHSHDDPIVDPRNSIDFYVACLQAGVAAELHIFPRGGHGYGLGAEESSEAQWPALCARWLEKNGLLQR